MIEHSVFALPFAYIAALTAMWQQTRSVHWVQLLLITVAMVSARTVAMSANRILDRRFDALNPRTARRELVTGELSVRSAWVGTVVALAVFLGVGRGAVVAVPGARADRGVPARPLLLRQAVHRLPAGAARAGAVRRAGRCVARGHRRRRLGAGRARHRGRHLDRRLRPHLLLPGRRDRPADRLALVPGPVRHRGRAARLVGRARRDARRVRVVRCRGRARLVVVDGRRAHRASCSSTSTRSSAPTTCPGSTGRSSPPTASSASACSGSRWPTCSCTG